MRRIYSIDSVCTDVAALAVVGANVRETPDTVLEEFCVRFTVVPTS